MAESILQEYDAKLDNKRRCIIHGLPSFSRYHVRVFKTGKIEMTPRILVGPEDLSENAIRMVYGSIRNLKKGKAGVAIDFKKHAKHLKDKD